VGCPQRLQHASRKHPNSSGKGPTGRPRKACAWSRRCRTGASFSRAARPCCSASTKAKPSNTRRRRRRAWRSRWRRFVNRRQPAHLRLDRPCRRCGSWISIRRRRAATRDRIGLDRSEPGSVRRSGNLRRWSGQGRSGARGRDRRRRRTCMGGRGLRRHRRRGRSRTEENVANRSEAWQSASVWRYDSGGSEQSPATGSEAADAARWSPETCRFAFFTSPLCLVQCSPWPTPSPAST